MINIDLQEENFYTLNSLIETDNLHPYCQNCLMEQVNRNRTSKIYCRGIPKSYDKIASNSTKRFIGSENIRLVLEKADPVKYLATNNNWIGMTTKYGGFPYQDCILQCTAFSKVFNGGRRTGKTVLAVRSAIYEAFANNKRVLFVTLGKSFRELCFDEIVSCLSENRVKSVANYDIRCFGGGRIRIVTDYRLDLNLRGQVYDYIIIDEASFIKNNPINIMRPFFDYNTKVFVTSCGGKKSGWLYDEFVSNPKVKVFNISSYNVFSTKCIDEIEETHSENAIDKEMKGIFV